jgi:uncharacterized protein (DUF1501 family)
MTHLSRRSVLGALGLAGLSVAAPGLALAAAPTDRRLVIVFLRGGLDGLSALPPVGDPDYARQRGGLALSATGNGAVLPLDGFFGLHPSLETLHGAWGAGELLPIHAIASPYRSRSHFDAQNVVETGDAVARRLKTGWLNRALTALGGPASGYAMAFSESMPLMLAGKAPAGSFAPAVLPQADDDFFLRVARLYEPDPFLSETLERALETRALAEDAMGGKGKRGGNQFASLAGPAGRFLAQEDGARIAVLDPSGWDTHARQGAASGQLANKLRQLDKGLGALKKELGPAWSKTAVLVATEFGRTVAVNGTGGTDHGTGGAAFVLGGAVKGGRVLADWPGLSSGALHQGRDLRPTTDMRALFKAALVEHLDLPRAVVDTEIFPDSAGVRPIQDVFRA